MKNRFLVGLTVGLFLFAVAGIASATLITIGTANYKGANYNLIYEDNSIFGGLVWFDHIMNDGNWQNQINWVSNLGSEITVSLFPGYTTTINWGTGWRLPVVDENKVNLTSVGEGWEGPDQNGDYDYRYGYNMVNSEMGHLFYESLSNKGMKATDGTYPQPGAGLYNSFDFKYLAYVYYSGTQYSPDPNSAWYFDFNTGYQDYTNTGSVFLNAMAVHPGDIVPAPEPSTLIIFGWGLLCIALVRKVEL